MSNLIKWTPMNIFDDMDRLVSDEWWPMARLPRLIAPAVDVYEDKGQVVVEASITGIKPADVNVEIEDNVLKISGQVEHRSEVDDQQYYRREIRSGAFHRTVPLPTAVKGDQAEASYKDGLLKITVPKAEEAKPKKIAIKTA